MRGGGGGAPREPGSDDEDFDFKKAPVKTKTVLINVRLARVLRKSMLACEMAIACCARVPVNFSSK